MAARGEAEEAIGAFLASVDAVDPTKRVKRSVREGRIDDWLADRHHPRTLQVLALGKASPRLVWGLVESRVPFNGVGVGLRGQQVPTLDGFSWHGGGHPLPDEGSLEAGRAVLDWAEGLSEDDHVLVLLSGGTSACIDWPEDDDAAALLERHRELVRAGLPIAELNRRRREGSAVKGGNLARRILRRTPHLRVWLLSDTPGAEPGPTVGSAPFWLEEDPERVPHEVLAGPEDALQAAGLHLGATGWNVHRHSRVANGDAAEEVDAFLDGFLGLEAEAPLALVSVAEPSVPLPPDAPAGGRARHSALLAAKRLAQDDPEGRTVFLAGATDGVDGVPGCSGAWSDRDTWGEGAAEALRRFDAASWMAARDRVFDLGPTGTNVSDIWIALRR